MMDCSEALWGFLVLFLSLGPLPAPSSSSLSFPKAETEIERYRDRDAEAPASLPPHPIVPPHSSDGRPLLANGARELP